MAIVSFDSSTLLNYYAAKLPQPTAPVTSGSASTVKPPWDISIPKPAQTVEDVAARSSDPYFDPNDQTLLMKAGQGTGSQNAGSELQALLKSTLSPASNSSASDPNLAADNDKLFALYSALNRLDYISQMATRDTTVSGQLPGLDASFQDGLNQILSFVANTQFNNLTVLPGQKTASTQSQVAIPYQSYTYQGGAVMADAAFSDPVPGVDASQSFTVSITKGGVKTDVPIDLSQVQGSLTLDNIATYVNQQLQAAGFGTRFSRVQTGGNITDGSATWGLQIEPSGSETVSLSSPQAAPAVYVAGASGTAADSQGKLVKLTGVDGTPATAFSANIVPDSGTASAKATAVDGNGNVYVIGTSTGSFGSELNQGSQDVTLTKFDSAGKVIWTKLLGAADTASGYGLAVDSTGHVVVAGSVTGDLTPTAIGGSSDSFVAKYDSEGNQLWVRQVAPLSADQANGVSIDSSGNIYVAGQVGGLIGAGATSAGGQDAYVSKLDSSGNLVYQRQFGTSGTDSAIATAVASDGNVIVASVQAGHAILTKYSSADGTSDPIWQQDLGDLQGGSLGGLTLANGKIYLSGTTANAALNAGGAATIANPNSGGTDAFVFQATDNGTSVAPDFVSYVGTADNETAGGVAVANGQIYLTGTTTGTFAGQTRNVAGTHNLFAAALASDGSVQWTQQYGGLDGQSQGFGIAVDATGSSVLDALKLGRGTIDLYQSNAIESQTSVRPGDYFTMQIDKGSQSRTVRVTIDSGETLRSLALKINTELMFDGTATALGIVGGQGLKIGANPGVSIQLIAGPKDFDALAGLGITPQVLVNDSTTNGSTTNSAGNTSTSTAKTDAATANTIGLGINVGINLLTTQAASHAHVVLMGAMALIKQAYGNINPSTQQASTTAAVSGSAPQYLQNQIANYQTALAWLSSLNAGGGTGGLLG